MRRGLYLGAIKGVAEGGDASKHLLHGLIEGVHCVVAALPQQHALHKQRKPGQHMQGRSSLAADNSSRQKHRGTCMQQAYAAHARTLISSCRKSSDAITQAVHEAPPPRYHRESTSMPHKERCKGRDTRRMGVASSTKGVHVRKCFTWTVACAVALVARPATPLARTGLVIRPVRPCMCTQNGKFILSSLYTSACACMGYYQPKNKDASESLLMP